VITTAQDGNSVELRCDPGSPTAWRAKDYHDEIIRIAKAAEPHDGSIYVIVGNKNTLVTPTDEFPLEEVPEDHVIVKEMSGQRVKGVAAAFAGASAICQLTTLGGFNRSSQHFVYGSIVGIRRGFPPVFSSQEFSGAWC
jgi:hypothetical protein